MSIGGEELSSSTVDARERRGLVTELAGAVSTQAQVANRAWIALITMSVFAVLPRVPTARGNLSLPFSLGEIDPTWFHRVAFFILVVLAVAFASAHAQQVRAQKLAQTVISSLGFGRGKDHVHPRDLFDILRKPSLNRLAPLAQSLRGKYQFFPANQDCPAPLLLLTASYYGLLKSVSILVYFILPLWALWRAFWLIPFHGFLQLTFGLLGLLAEGTLVQVLLEDIKYAAEILKHLWRSPQSARKGN